MAEAPVICVIGSGPGGGIVALELLERTKATVLVVDLDSIDAGYVQRPEDMPAARNAGTPFNLEATRGFGFGGTSNLWHGVLTELDDEDWANLDAAAGRAISGEVRACYDRLGKYFQYGGRYGSAASLRRPISGPLHDAIALSGRFVPKDFVLQMRPFRSRAHLRRASTRAGNGRLRFVERATAVRLERDANDPSVLSHLVIARDGKEERVAADLFVISLGALESPRFLRDTMGPDTPPQCGSFLTDHPWTVIGEIHARRGRIWLGSSDTFAGRGRRYRVGFRPARAVHATSIGVNHCISVKPLFVSEYDEFKEAMKAIISTRLAARAIISLFRRFSVGQLGASVLQLSFEKFGFGVFVRRVLVFAYLEQPSRAESEVRSTSERDVNGRSVPEFRWAIGAEERDALRSLGSDLGEAMNATERFQFVPYDVERCVLSSGAHHAGTMRIGRTRETGVVDSDLRVHGLRNAWACDLSIFPNYGNANPTLTLGAFAVRLADHLAARLAEETA